MPPKVAASGRDVTTPHPAAPPSSPPMFSRNTTFVLTALVILFVANMGMAYGLTNYPTTTEAFISRVVKEGFSNPSAMAAESGDAYKPMSPYDGVRGVPPHGESQWRYKTPNEPLDASAPPSDMFLFAQNQCKPECCGASYSCGGGCVCTTAAQRQLIASRGGNRTAPEDGV